MYRAVIFFAAICVCNKAVFADEASLRYDWQPGQVFAYKATVAVDLPDKVETFQGVIHYTVKEVAADSRLVVYQGGLGKSTKSKEEARPRGFGPRRIGPPPSPFARNNFRGTEQTTNEITLSPTGQVTKLKGDSQLPYLLGNVSLLPFEPLSETGKKDWKVEGGTSITEKSDRDERFPRFGRMDPFGRGAQDEEVQAASESASYAVAGVEKDIVTVKKVYELKSPAPKAGEQGFTLSGNGTWTFNTKLGVPESLHMEQKLVVSTNNQQVTVPITIDYRRLSEEELAAHRAEQDRLAALARERHEEHLRAKAEEKRIAETPLTAAEKEQALAALKGDDNATKSEILATLAKKSVPDPDAEIATAIEALLKDRERSVREAAHKALLQWSTAYRPRGELDARYRGPHGVEPTGRGVAADTPLFVGQILLMKDNNRWIPADVLEVQADGRAKVHPRGWSTDAWDKVLARADLQLAPEELFQPARSPDQASSVALRTWTDKTGTHKIEATYLGLENGKLRIKRKDGREIAVALDSLSKEDQEYVAQRQKAAAAPPNPFEP